MFLTTKTNLEANHMTHLHFTLKTEEIQNLIDQSVKDDLSKTILTTVFQQLMEEQRTQYIKANEYERSDERVSQRNGYYKRGWTTRIGTLDLEVPRTRDGKFSPNVFERYQRNEKALLASMLEMYISNIDRKSTRLNSSHVAISYAVFCLKKKNKKHIDSKTYKIRNVNIHD